jgi:hypothetical protein
MGCPNDFDLKAETSEAVEFDDRYRDQLWLH